MNFYAARQPILNTDQSLFAYEMLYRDSIQNIFPEINDDQATAKLIEGLQFNLGLETLAKDSLAFINFTHQSLLSGYPYLLPNDKIVVEILETATPGKRLLEACIELKKRGYIIALDDYEHSKVWMHFFPHVDIIKLDYSLTSETQFKQIVAATRSYPQIKLLAEKIETHEQFQHAKNLGCVYFQGYFFSRPEVVKSVAFSPSQLAVVNLMTEMSRPEPNLNQVVTAFEGDVNLSFKLLRYLQSPIFKRRSEIVTIKQAAVALGHQELKRFVCLLFTAQFSEEKCEQLSIMSLARAKFCEQLVEEGVFSGEHASAFLVGLLSLIDALVDADIKELMDKLPLCDDIKQAIVNRKGDAANLLKLCELYEHADWDKLDHFCQKIAVDPEKIGDIYQQSITWATERYQALS